jgi:predicted DNA binding protein
MTISHPAGARHWTRVKPDRILRGANAPGAKLTEEQIRAICVAFEAGEMNKSELARFHGVSRITIWRHIRESMCNTRKSNTTNM